MYEIRPISKIRHSKPLSALESGLSLYIDMALGILKTVNSRGVCLQDQVEKNARYCMIRTLGPPQTIMDFTAKSKIELQWLSKVEKFTLFSQYCIGF